MDPTTFKQSAIAAGALPKSNISLGVTAPAASGTYVQAKPTTANPFALSDSMTALKTTATPTPATTMATSAATALPPTNINLGITTPPKVAPVVPTETKTTTNSPATTQAAADKAAADKVVADKTATDLAAADKAAADTAAKQAADAKALADAQAEYQKTSQQVQQTILNIQNGSTPLTAGEQAQIEGLRQQFQGLIDTQTLINTGAKGVANVRGYQKGAAEYDPTFQNKIIGSIISAGAAKVSDLQIKEASAIAALTQSFKDNDIKAVKDAWGIYQDASGAKTDALQKVVDDSATAIKEAQKQQLQVQQDNLILDAMNKGLTTPQDIFTALHGSVPLDQITSTMKNLQDASGITTKTDQVGNSVYQYQVDATGKIIGTPQKIISGPPPVGTAAERSAGALSQFASAFTPGALMADGTPTVDINGYINPKAWKAAIADAPAEGITRKDFIEQFGSMLYAPKDGIPDKSYGLTPSEIKIITGALP